jgi:hypothetical protein
MPRRGSWDRVGRMAGLREEGGSVYQWCIDGMTKVSRRCIAKVGPREFQAMVSDMK